MASALVAITSWTTLLISSSEKRVCATGIARRTPRYVWPIFRWRRGDFASLCLIRTIPAIYAFPPFKTPAPKPCRRLAQMKPRPDCRGARSVLQRKFRRNGKRKGALACALDIRTSNAGKSSGDCYRIWTGSVQMSGPRWMRFNIIGSHTLKGTGPKGSSSSVLINHQVMLRGRPWRWRVDGSVGWYRSITES